MADERGRLARFLASRRGASPQSEPEAPEPEPLPGPAWLYGPRPGGCSLHAQLVALHGQGATPAIAAAAAGLEVSDLSKWLLAGAEGHEDYRRLWVDCRAATAEFVLGCINDVRRARDVKGNPVWSARKWLVESLEKGAYEPAPREVPAPGAPSSKRAMLAELQKACADIEAQLAAESLIGQDATDGAPATRAPAGGSDDAGDRSEDPTST